MSFRNSNDAGTKAILSSLAFFTACGGSEREEGKGFICCYRSREQQKEQVEHCLWGGVVEGTNLAEVGEGVSEASSWGGSGRNTTP